MKRALTCILSAALFGAVCVMCSCAAPRAVNNNPPSGDYTFDVSFVNNTLFDVEILDETRVIPGLSGKAVTLPAHLGELSEGYKVNYIIRLTDELVLRVPRNENIIIRRDQREAVIESPDFMSERSFLIVKNGGNHPVSLKDENEYLNGLANAEPIVFASSPYISPGQKRLYELTPGKASFSIESDQYRHIDFSLSSVLPGRVYSFTFDGTEAFPTDIRSLTEIGQAAPLRVEFSGTALSETEKRELAEALETALERYNVPLRPVASSSRAENVFYTLRIVLDTYLQPAAPPVNVELVRGELTLSLIQNNKVRAFAEHKNLIEMSRKDMLHLASNLVQNADAFYHDIKEEVIR